MSSAEPAQSEGFGTVKGVLIPNITMMFGVILFLRLGVIVASSGITSMLAAIGLSLVIMLLTSLSIGSLVTNMRVGAGGVYYIISRLLGIEVGGAVGLGIYFAQLISITLTVSGFATSVVDLFPTLTLHWVELATLLVLALLSGVSSSWSLRLQGGILALLIAGIVSVFLGNTAELTPPVEPVVPFYSGGSLSFWQTFALFYPAMTGIEAGMAMSGSLRNPSRSLFYGNVIALVFVAIAYSAISVFAAVCVPHETLVSDPFALVDFAFSTPLVRVAVWGATLSSALGCLLGAPRMLQSMAADGVLIPSLAEPIEGDKEPHRALLVTTVLAAILMLLTTIDQIIPMLAMICLITYGLLNLVAAISQLMNTPAWRPRLRTPWLMSIAAVGLIFIAMVMIAPGWSFVTLAILAVLYVVLRARDVESGFQDLRESFIFFLSRLTLYRLGTPTQHALTWHPQLLVLGGAPSTMNKLVQLTHRWTRRSGMLTYATVIPEEWQTPERMQSVREAYASYFEGENIACLTEVYPAATMNEGYVQLIKAYGIGPIQPNTVALQVSKESVDAHLVHFIDTCRLMQKNVVLFRDSSQVADSIFSSRAGSHKKRIYISWNPEDTAAFDLTMSLVTTLTDGLVFRGASVTVMARVSQENAIDDVQKYLETFFHRSRIAAEVIVYCDTPPEVKHAHLRFQTLSLPEQDEGVGYEAHVHNQLLAIYQALGQCPENEACAFVACFDNIDHRAIYVPNQN